MDQPSLGRRAVAEAIGTFALVFAGCGAIVTDAERDGALGEVGIGLVFFLVLLAAIASLGHVSGAHFNPGVSLSFFLTRHLPARDLGAYWVALAIGAAVAALLLLAVWPGHPADLGATDVKGRRGAGDSSAAPHASMQLPAPALVLKGDRHAVV